MRRNLLPTLIASIALAVFAGQTALTQAPAPAPAPAPTKKEEKVPLDQLPKAVKEAAEKAVKGIVLTEAEKETKGDKVTYEVEGKANGKEWEIAITPEGKVLEIEEDKDDDKDDDKKK